MTMRIGVTLFVVALLVLQGCVAVQTFPSVARAGDTITLALGSVDGLDKTKMTLSYVPQSTGVAIDITANIRSVLKIYPDRTSPASLNNTYTAFLTAFSGHAAWMNMAVINLPATLPTGPGYFQVDFNDSVRVPNTSGVVNAEGLHIATEILAGTGAANSFTYYTNPPANTLAGNFQSLEPLPHVVLRAAATTNYAAGTKHPAAAEFRIQLPITGDVQAMDDSEVHVIWDYKPGEDNMQIQLSWHRLADVITVNVLVPTNIALSERLFQFSIVIDKASNNNLININGTPQLLSYKYFDLNGNEMTAEFTPEVVVMK